MHTASYEDVDIAIVGGGCAGLSLAVHLLRQTTLPMRRMIIVEPRTAYVRDRSWCYWNMAAHPFENAVTHRWKEWNAVSVDGHKTRHTSHVYTYNYVDSGMFYRSALEQLSRDPRVTIKLGETLLSLQEHEACVTLHTSNQRYRALYVFDSRPPELGSLPPGEIRLYQHFYGQYIRSEKPVFDPSAATLMDFRVDQSHGIHFMYLLPFDPHHALVEDTYMSEATLPHESYLTSIDRYLCTHYEITHWDVIWDEHGKIPMTTEQLAPHATARVIPIGIRGGLAKPSTGYAFLAIQEFSHQLAQQPFFEKIYRVPTIRRPLNRFLDRVFLNYLKEHPAQGPEIFMKLFCGVSTDTLVRFLTDHGSIIDASKIMKALPMLPFAMQTIKSMRLLH